MDYYDEKGTRRRRSLKTADRVIAFEREKEFVKLIKTIRPEKTESILWHDFKRWYLKYLSENKAAGTKYIHELAIKYLEEYHSPKYLRDITPEYLANFKGYIANKAKNNRNKPGAAGRNRAIRAIKTMMYTAERFKKIGIKQDWEIIEKDKSEAENRIVWHTLEELRQIKDILDGDLLTVFFLGWEEGLRRGEIAHLYKTDYNPATHTITISKKRDWNPKTKKSARTIPLRPDSEAAIQRSVAAAPKNSPYIINLPGRDKEDYLSHQYRHAVKSNLSNINSFIHKLRHTYGTLLVKEGVPIKIISDLMGHTNVLQTEKYIHLGQPEYAAAVAKMPSI